MPSARHRLAEFIGEGLFTPPDKWYPAKIEVDQKKVFCSEFVNLNMKLLSAAEDLAIRTLGNVSGSLGKLLYLGSLRGADGRYFHWGLAQVHGDAESQVAVKEAHAAALKEVLRKPIRQLWSEIASSPDSKAAGIKRELGSQGDSKLLPEGCSRRSESHFNSVLRALAELSRGQKRGSTRPAA